MKTDTIDDFSETVLKTLNPIYEHFKLIKKIDSIYIFGYKKDTYTCKEPLSGGTLDLLYLEKDIIIIDKSCVKSFTKKWMIKNGRWKEVFNNKDILRGFSIGCKIFGDIVKKGH